MNNLFLPRFSRSVWQVFPLVIAFSLAGCQSYQPLPIDLSAHEANVASRLAEDESLKAFSLRLKKNDAEESFEFSTNDGINSAEAEVIALFYNPDLRMARLRAGVALANAENAGLWEDPVFGFDGAELLSPAGPFEYGLTASLTIPISGRLGVEQDLADTAYEAELRRVVDAEWTMRAKVREAWAAWSVAAERLRLIDQVVEEITRISAVSDRLEEAGELTRVESRLLRSQLIALRVERLSAEAETKQMRLKIMGLMGLLPSMQVDLLPVLPATRFSEQSDANLRLIQANTSLAVLRADYAVAEERLRLEVRKQYPDIEIGAGLGSEDNDDRLLLGASLPLPIFNANRGGIAEARANRELARASAESEFERLSFQLASIQANLKVAEQQQEILEKNMVPMLDEQAKEIDRLAELGEVNTLILLETVTRRFEAKSQILDLHLDILRGEIGLVQLLGPDEVLVPASVSESNKQTTSTGSESAAEGASK